MRRCVKISYFSSLASEAAVESSLTSPQADDKTSPALKVKSANKTPSRSRKIKVEIPVTNIYNVFPILRQHATAKFDETVEMAVKLSVDPRKPNQSIKGVAKLPGGTGKKVRVAVFATGDDKQKALEAGADVVGSDDLIQSIQNGDVNFDRVIATPEMMAQVSKIGKVSPLH
jgi:large subunit ribosomal protein L1